MWSTLLIRVIKKDCVGEIICAVNNQERTYEDFNVRILSLDLLDLYLERISHENIKWSVYKQTHSNIYISCTGLVDGSPIIILPCWSHHNTIYTVISIKTINGITELGKSIISDQFETLINSCKLIHVDEQNIATIQIEEIL
jgi:hypothetical protein